MRSSLTHLEYNIKNIMMKIQATYKELENLPPAAIFNQDRLNEYQSACIYLMMMQLVIELKLMHSGIHVLLTRTGKLSDLNQW